MQTTASFGPSVQPNILKTMQPQPAQNMFVQPTVANSSSQVRTNPAGNLYRGPSASPAPRNGARHVPMPAMYPPTMHQGVVVQPFPQYQRQAFPAPPYAQFSQPIQPNYPYPYPSYYPVPTQRGAVSVSTNVGVGNTMTVQQGPNGPMSGPPGATQPQMSLAPGTVLAASAVPPGSNPAVLGVSPNPAGQQVGVQSIVGVVQTAMPTQQNQKKVRRRLHALEIIDPNTNKNILEDFDGTKTSASSEIEYAEPNLYVQQPIVMADQMRNMPYDMIDMPQISRDINLAQTPIVSAITEGPAVEIVPTLQKPRSKKILPIVNPKDENSVQNTESQPTDIVSSRPLEQHAQHQLQPQQLAHMEEVGHMKTTENFLPQLTYSQYQNKPSHQVSQISTKQEQGAAESPNVVINDNISKEGTVEDGNSHHQQQVSSTELTNTVSVAGSPLASDAIQNLNTGEAEGLNVLPIYGSTNIAVSLDSQQKDFSPYGIAKSEKHKSVNNEDSTAAISSVLSPSLEDLNAPSMYLTDEISAVVKEIDCHSVDIKNGPDQSTANNGVTINNELPSSTESPLDGDWLHKIKVSCTEIESSVNETESVQDQTQSQHQESQSSSGLQYETLPNDSDETDRALLQQKQDSKEISGRTELSTTSVKKSTEISDSENENNGVLNNNSNDNENNENDARVKEMSNTSGDNEQTGLQQFLISYNEGQWSPNNPSGKKQYDRDQLLRLREAKASRRQPEVNNVSILPTPNLLPSFIRPKRVQSMVGSLSSNRGATGSISGADSSNYGNKQASMSGVHGRGSMKGMIHVNLSLNQDVKLNETDNAWRPRVLVKGDGEADPEAKTKREKDELIRRVRGILNKLTPEKFDTLVEEIIKLKIDTPDKMEDVMVLVFEKAIDEPNFSVSYARLCHRLITEVKARDERMESGTKTNLAQFRAALLDKTEREFTQNVTKSKAKEKKLQPIIEKIANCAESAEKVELEAQLEEEERKIRRRSGGTVRFIGELFKISMLTGKIINSCIDTLLNPNSEDQLECLCKLLTTVGAKFEQTPVNMKESLRCYSLDKTISRMQAISLKTDKEGAKVSSRVRFMLQDVIDLRRDKWQSKRIEAPKTMGQVEKEMKTEQLSSHYLNYAGSVSGGVSTGASSLGSGGKRDDRGGSGRYNDSRSGYGGSHSQRGDSGSLRRQPQIVGNSGNTGGNHSISNNDDNTWHVQTSKGGSRVLDAIKLEGLTTANNFDTKKMGGVSQFIWSQRQSSTPTSTPTNSFAALSALSDTSRSNDRDRDRSGPRNKGSYNKGSMERDRYGMHPRSGSSQASRESSSSRGQQQSRSAMGNSSMPKSTSHSKFTQQTVPSSNRMSGKFSATGSSLYPQRECDSFSLPNKQVECISVSSPTEAPTAVFEKFTDGDERLFKSVVSEMLEVAAHCKTLKNSIEPCILQVREGQRSALLYYIMTDYLHLRQIGKLQRRYLGNVVVYLINNHFIAVEHFKLGYKQFCEIASDLALDIPDLWKYIIEFTGPLINKRHVTIYDLWNQQLQETGANNFGEKFLKTFLDYSLSEIGPSFTRSMCKKTPIKWTDFMDENVVKDFIQTNKFEYIENDKIQPTVATNEAIEDNINAVSENIEHLLKEEAAADSIIDYINGNIVDINKQFIRSIANKLCDFAISYTDNSYKLETDSFQKICIPVLQRYIDSKEEFELECLYSMQLLVARLEYPRGLLSDLFGELYDADVIPQDSFIKWRDSKDQSAGKGVAVKGLNPFFNHVLSSETSDENN